MQFENSRLRELTYISVVNGLCKYTRHIGTTLRARGLHIYTVHGKPAFKSN